MTYRSYLAQRHHAKTIRHKSLAMRKMRRDTLRQADPLSYAVKLASAISSKNACAL